MTALLTFGVALLLALALPVSQLRTASITTSCCCPDPAKCHCPDHDDSRPGQPELRACHQRSQVTVAPTLPVFAAPAVALAAPLTITAAPSAPVPPTPHAAPAPVRPDAPS